MTDSPDRTALTRAAEHAFAWLDGLDTRSVATTASVADLRARLGRPLADQGVAATRVIDDLVADTAGGILGSQSGSREWVRQRLGNLADPTAWLVKSHRTNVAGQLAEFTKKSYLKAAGPVLTDALAGQRKWNEAMISLLEAWATPGADDGHC